MRNTRLISVLMRCMMERSVPDWYLLGAQAAVLMFDVSSRTSYRNIPTYFRDIVRVCDHIPIVLVRVSIVAIYSSHSRLEPI